MSGVEANHAGLRSSGFVHVEESLGSVAEAFELARSLIDADHSDDGLGRLSIVGDFVLPPADGPPTRDFQTLHFDFGLPLDPKVDHDAARYTALHIPTGTLNVSAMTRLVPLGALLEQRSWPALPELVENIVAYGRTHGAWDDACGYVEGSLARITEAAAGSRPELPSVKADTGFLCGLEFDSLPSETSFFARQGLLVDHVAVEIPLRPGELLLFDNFALAHGRRGTRAPAELRQRVFGHRRLTPASQHRLRARFLSAFYPDTRGAVV
jgi:hypothetical protein